MIESIRTLLIICLAFLMSAVLVGCGDDEAEPETSEVAESDSTTRTGDASVARLKNDFLAYVPANTALFVGTAEPVDEDEYLAFFKTGMFKSVGMNDALDRADPDEDGARVMLGLYSTYLKTLGAAPEELSDRFGTGTSWNAAMYTVQALPVFRMAIERKDAFDAVIDSVEQEKGVQSRQSEVGGYRVRQYRLDATEDGARQLDLVIATGETDVVITLHSAQLGDESLDRVLGISKPEESVLDSGELAGIVDRHGFKNAFVGYVDHAEVLQLLSDPDAVPFLALGKAMNPDNDPSQPNAEPNPLQTPECRTELTDVVSRWPRTVFGYTRWDADTLPMNFDGVGRIETTNTVFLDEFRKIQGQRYMPSGLIEASPAFVLGLGLDFDALLPFISWYRDSLQANGWKCEPLQKYVASFDDLGGAQLAMAGTVLSGIKGATLAVIDAVVTPQRKLETLDAMISIVTANPARLATLMTSTPFMSGQVSSDGSPSPLQIGLPDLSHLQPMLQTRENSVALHVGERSGAIAATLGQEDPVQGFVSMQIDYGKYFGLLSQGMQSSMASMSDGDREMFEQMRQMKATAGFSISVGQDAIEFGSTLHIPK